MALSSAALIIGFVHCVCGPDHYIPFVAMSRVGVWSLRKTLLVTVICGIGHVLGSAALGFVGIAAGVILFQLESVEHLRGDVAAWLLLVFGAAYLAWGLVHARRGHRHAVELESVGAAAEPEFSTRGPGVSGSRGDNLTGGDLTSDDLARDNAATARQHGHAHDAQLATDGHAGGTTREFTPWILFVIFLFGPCEPLIPLLMYPAAQANVWSVVWVTAVFGITTLVTMVAIVALIYWGALASPWRTLGIYGHAAGGAVVMACGGIILLQTG